MTLKPGSTQEEGNDPQTNEINDAYARGQEIAGVTK
jgi:hypothetical protein